MDGYSTDEYDHGALDGVLCGDAGSFGSAASGAGGTAGRALQEKEKEGVKVWHR